MSEIMPAIRVRQDGRDMDILISRISTIEYVRDGDDGWIGVTGAVICLDQVTGAGLTRIRLAGAEAGCLHARMRLLATDARAGAADVRSYDEQRARRVDHD